MYMLPLQSLRHTREAIRESGDLSAHAIDGSSVWPEDARRLGKADLSITASTLSCAPLHSLA